AWRGEPTPSGGGCRWRPGRRSRRSWRPDGVGFVGLDRRARADEVAIAVGIVDPRNRRPELASAQPGYRIGRLLPGIGMRPVRRTDVLGRMRRLLQRIVRAI